MASNGQWNPHMDSDSEFLGATEADSTARNNERLYALLNLPRTATPDEIREKYKALAVVLHPDKQTTDAQRLVAQDRFRLVQGAYEVLSNPTRRAIYDELGEEGLRSDWAVGQKFKSATEIREEIQRLARKRTVASVENSLRSQGDLICSVDARILAISDADLPKGLPSLTLRDRIDGVRCSALVLRHSFRTDITPTTKVTVGARVARGGAGSLLGTVRHQYSPRLWFETDINILNPRSATVKSYFAFDDKTQYTLVTHLSPRQFAPPLFTLGLARVLYPGTQGIITFHTGSPWLPRFIQRALPAPAVAPSSLDVTLQSDIWSTGLDINQESGIGLVGRRTINITDDTQIVLGGGYSLLSGASFMIEGTQRLADSLITGGLKLGCGLSVGFASGVTLKLRFVRPGQRIVIPIRLADQSSIEVALLAGIVPTLGMFAAEYFLLHPARIGKGRFSGLRAKYAEELAARRKAAEEEIELLRDSVSKKVQSETSRDGLIILEAIYSAVQPRSTTDSIDVTIPVQALVQSSQLSIPGGRSKALLIGFYDPCFGERKVLTIRYLFRGKEHRVEVEDHKALLAPLRGHLIRN